MSDNHTKWVNTVPNVKNLANQHQLIIVCPDGAYSGWYLDSPYDAQSQYESFIAKELLLFVDSQYRTLAGKKGRIISGLSMGGHGALYLAMRNPQNYAAAGSMSGAVDIYRLAANESLANETAKTLGKFEKNQDLWKKHSVLHNLDLLKKAQTAYIIDCGLDDFLLQENKDLHTAMVQEKIPHEYIERPGGHEWKYWEKAIETQLNFLCGYLQRE
jgi:S-formylglutathione hydrolase FrmB